MLLASLQADMLKIGNIREHVSEHIVEHDRVCLLILSFYETRALGYIEDLGDIGEREELHESIIEVGDVALHVLEGWAMGRRLGGERAVGDTIHLLGTAGSFR